MTAYRPPTLTERLSGYLGLVSMIVWMPVYAAGVVFRRKVLKKY